VKFLLLLIVLAGAGYYLLQITPGGQKIRTYFGSGYNQVKAGDLFSTASLYSGKKVCVNGYYLESAGIPVLKATFDADVYRNSAWVINASDKQILIDALGDGKGANVRLCGKFESSRAEFGQSSLWDNQITVEDFQLLGKTSLLPR
jgi:hypothetical protein